MALVKGTNSYITVSEADTYFEDRVNAATWNEDFSDDEKAMALVTATSILDEQPWIGFSSEEQDLVWPRTGSYLDRPRGRYIQFGSAVPQAILDATAELALHLLSNADVLESSGGVTSLSLGPIELDTIKPTSIFTGRAKALTRKFLVSGGNRSVFVGA